jgi:hypothetical protein
VEVPSDDDFQYVPVAVRGPGVSPGEQDLKALGTVLRLIRLARIEQQFLSARIEIRIVERTK